MASAIYQDCTFYQYYTPVEGNDWLKADASKYGDMMKNHSSSVGVTVGSKASGKVPTCPRHTDDISEILGKGKAKKSKKASPSLCIKKNKNQKKKGKRPKKAKLAYHNEENESFREKIKRLLEEGAVRLREEIIDKIDPSARRILQPQSDGIDSAYVE